MLKPWIVVWIPRKTKLDGLINPCKALFLDITNLATLFAPWCTTHVDGSSALEIQSSNKLIYLLVVACETLAYI